MPVHEIGGGGAVSAEEPAAVLAEHVDRISHDIGNMLTVVNGSIETIAAIAERDKLDPAVAEELRIIAEVTSRAGQLVRELQAFAGEHPTQLLSDVHHAVEQLGTMQQSVVGATQAQRATARADAASASIAARSK